MSASDMQVPARPRLLLVRNRITVEGGELVRRVGDELTNTLSLHFDVHVQEEDFDFAEACDRIMPDLVVLESPGEARSVPLSVSNRAAHRNVPRLAYSAMDQHDTSRPAFMRMISDWGVENIFLVNNAQEVHSPELIGKVYITGLCFDERVFHEYGENKIIPVTVFGGKLLPNFYPWRAQLLDSIAAFFPTLSYTHPGYGEHPRWRFPIFGEQYARMINRSWFSVADASRMGQPVRKHLEIPASGAVLISPEGPGLAEYGFKDMENAILGSGRSLYEKIAAAASDPELYEKIRRNGYELVHGRYARPKWTAIRDWHRCYCSLKPGERVVQQGLGGPFLAVPQTGAGGAVCLREPYDNEYTRKMKSIVEAVRGGANFDQAIADAKDVLSWVGHIGSECYLLCAIISLLNGKPDAARDLLLLPRKTRRFREAQQSPLDPCEVSWLILTGLLLGDSRLVTDMLTEAAAARHLSVRRMIWLLKQMASGRVGGPEGRAKVRLGRPSGDLMARQKEDQFSIHWMGQDSFDEWLSLIERILKKNGVDVERASGFGAPGGQNSSLMNVFS